MGDCGQGVALTVVGYIFLILTVDSKNLGLLMVRGYWWFSRHANKLIYHASGK